MKKIIKTLKLYRSPFVVLPAEWDILNLNKYLDLPLNFEWTESVSDAEVVIIPSHLSPKSAPLFESFQKTIPQNTLLLIYPVAFYRVTDLMDILGFHLTHRHWTFPSSVLVPEEIIQLFKKQFVG